MHILLVVKTLNPAHSIMPNKPNQILTLIADIIWHYDCLTAILTVTKNRSQESLKCQNFLID